MIASLPDAFVVDAMVAEEECRQAIAWADQHAQAGEGYDGDEHFHGKSESYYGLLVVPVSEGPCPLPVRLNLIALLERMRLRLVEHYHEPRLRCATAAIGKRSAVPGIDRPTLTHPYHCDHNTRSGDAWRLYTAVVYLNDTFDGGQVVFPDPDHPNAAIAAGVEVGRMIGFNGQTPHGVAAIQSGTRYTLVGWYGVEAPDAPPLPKGYVRIAT